YGKGSPGAAAAVAGAGEGGLAVEAAVETTAVADAGLDGVEVEVDGGTARLKHGSVVIAAITSCTNTSNPSVMVAAGLVARNAVAKGLQTAPQVKTSLAPGSRVVTDYLEKSQLDESLDAIGFQTVGYGCTTCIGNSGPLPGPIADAVDQHDLVVAGVLSGNRNFEGRINPHVKANYLASPPLVVAYALAGSTDVDLVNEPLGFVGGDDSGEPVFLDDLWPSNDEIRAVVDQCVLPEMFQSQYDDVWQKNPKWNAIDVSGGELFEWINDSTYIQEPPFLLDLKSDVDPIRPIAHARCLALLGDSVTTDHISPAGSIAASSPAGKYLQGRGVKPREFNSYGSRRGNDRVMTRGTFANIRIRNQLAPGSEGGVTRHLPDGEQMAIYDAAMKYRDEGVPLVVLAGAEYGTGSSRDWAAKGTFLLGVRAVIAASYERIHRSNLVGMGVLPLQFADGDTWQTLGLSGEELFEIPDLNDELEPRQSIKVVARRDNAQEPPIEFVAQVRIDTPVELDYYRNGGILQTVLRRLLQ
ncbi:MAG: aconitate hydratase AcnA, partial [Planctomycetota bacterium]